MDSYAIHLFNNRNYSCMDIKSIIKIVNSDLPESHKEKAILSILSNDEKIIPHIMEILENERRQKKELILDSNLELSRALVTLIDDTTTNRKWVIEEIKKHYLKWKNYIKCNFKIDGLD